MVYVISIDNKPLMPCSNVIARLLLKNGKAKVKRKCPFTIKLMYPTSTYTQNLTLGVDTGSSHIGSSVSDDKGNIYYMSDTKIRNDIADKMKQRLAYRRNRRERKTRYRKARFLNRKNSKKKDRFSPTMISKFHSHVKEIEFIQSILPITTLVLETGNFDTHLMKNPSLAKENVKHWGYQQGANYGFENTKAKVLNRDNYTCQCCKGKRKDSKLEVHHIIFRSNGGSDEEDNLITLCHTCHFKVHHGLQKLNLKGKVKGTLKFATQMNSIRKHLLERVYPDAIETFGYVTKQNRYLNGVEKSHYLDACMIASGGKQIKILQKEVYFKVDVAKGDYQQRKGIRSEKVIPTGKMKGIRKFDKVRYLGKEYFVKGRMSSGYGILMDIDGKKIDFSHLKKGKTPKLHNLERISARTTQMIDRKVI